MPNTLSIFYWSADPEAFSLGPITVRWYGMLFALAFLLGYYLVSWIFRLEHKNESDLDRLFLHMFLGIVLGARLGHCLFYEPAYFLSNPLEILKIWRGGLASHGALIGVFLALFIYAKKAQDQSYLWVLSRMTLPCALGGSLIRLGNLLNSEIIGKPSTLPWAVVFEVIDRTPRHPSQLYESLSYLLVFFVLLFIYRKTSGQAATKLLLGIYLSLTFSFRFLIEFTKEPQSGFEQNWFLDLGQLLSLPLIGLGLALLYCARRNKSTSP